jgi:endonuclease YncB( thermonuclease family)
MAGNSIRCELKDTDRYGRSVGLCRAGEQDVGDSDPDLLKGELPP